VLCFPWFRSAQLVVTQKRFMVTNAFFMVAMQAAHGKVLLYLPDDTSALKGLLRKVFVSGFLRRSSLESLS